MKVMKYEWRKQEKGLYLPSTEQQITTVGRQKFFAIRGQGDPNEKDFAERVGVLYSLAYAIRMMPKSGYTPDGYFEYMVYPLEGVWENTEAEDKAKFVYTIMIRQPEFVTAEIAQRAVEVVKKKKPHLYIADAEFCEIEDGLSVQILHHGDYDDEPLSFAKMQEFMTAKGLKRKSDTHREIYLTDATKTERNENKTVLRYRVTE